jgi:hypothetical protein
VKASNFGALPVDTIGHVGNVSEITPEQAHAAARVVARHTAADSDARRTILQALGLA